MIACVQFKRVPAFSSIGCQDYLVLISCCFFSLLYQIQMSAVPRSKDSALEHRVHALSGKQQGLLRERILPVLSCHRTTFLN